MVVPVTIIAFAGSTRAGSFNKKLINVAAGAAADAGAEVVSVDLAEYPMPLYDGDMEKADGLPAAATSLRAKFIAADGFLISAPEYNSGYSAVLKNTIDWISRPQPDEPPLVAFAGKVVGLMSASPGAMGGMRGLVQLRMLLSNINMLVVPDQFALAKAMAAFDEDGNLKAAEDQARVAGIAAKVVDVAGRLRS